MRLLVLSSCTAKKSVSHPEALTYETLSDPTRRAERMAALASLTVPAAQLYTGMPHVHVMSGLQALRSAPWAPPVALKIISAGFGLVDEADSLPPYECKFSGMKLSPGRGVGAVARHCGAVKHAVVNADCCGSWARST